MRCTPSAAGATTIVPPRSRMVTRIPGAHPIARTTLRSAPAGLVHRTHHVHPCPPHGWSQNPATAWEEAPDPDRTDQPWHTGPGQSGESPAARAKWSQRPPPHPTGSHTHDDQKTELRCSMALEHKHGKLRTDAEDLCPRDHTNHYPMAHGLGLRGAPRLIRGSAAGAPSRSP